MANTFLDRVSNKAMGQLLIEKGTLSPEQCEEALAVAKRDNLRLGEALVMLGYVTPEALGYALGEQYGIRPMELHPSMVDQSLVRRFPFELLLQHRILPLIEVDDELVVVVSDPNNTVGLEALAALIPGYRISAQLAEEAQIRRCLETLSPSTRRSAISTQSLAQNVEQNSATSAPKPSDPAFTAWLISCVLHTPEDDLIIRQMGAETEICRRKFGDMTDSSPLRILNTFPASAFSTIRETLLLQCTPLEFTNSLAARMGPISYQGKVYDLQVTSYPAARAPLLQIRPLVKNVNDEGQTELQVPQFLAGSCTVIFYHGRRQLENYLAALIRTESARHLLLLLQSTARRSYDNLVSLPAHFASTAAAAGASGATLIFFDHPPALSEVLRLTRASAHPPAIVCFAPVLEEEGMAGVSSDIDDLVTRLSPELVYLDRQTAPDSANANQEVVK